MNGFTQNELIQLIGYQKQSKGQVFPQWAVLVINSLFYQSTVLSINYTINFLFDQMIVRWIVNSTNSPLATKKKKTEARNSFVSNFFFFFQHVTNDFSLLNHCVFKTTWMWMRPILVFEIIVQKTWQLSLSEKCIPGFGNFLKSLHPSESWNLPSKFPWARSIVAIGADWTKAVPIKVILQISLSAPL